jgi:uncharacterized delta-60 repeat protein
MHRTLRILAVSGAVVVPVAAPALATCKGITMFLGVLAVLSLDVLGAWAAPGDLDPSFGPGGVVSTPGSKNAVVIQPDGKIVVAGALGADFSVVRYLTDGSPDLSFDFDGRATASFANGAGANAAALQLDGKIVVAGIADNPNVVVEGWSVHSSDFALARFNLDGSLDPTFGSGGMVTTSFSPYGNGAWGVAIQVDSLLGVKIVAVGYADRVELASPGGGYDDVRPGDLALARYNNDGSPDLTFGVSGKLTTKYPGSLGGRAHAVVIQADRKMVTAGWWAMEPPESPTSPRHGRADLAFVRYLETGALDPSFGTGGMVQTDLTGPDGEDSANGLALQSDGKLVAAAVGDFWGEPEFTLVRYASDGILDQSFGTGGIRKFQDHGWANAVAVQPNGRIVAAGGSPDLLARVTADGTPDPDFGTEGLVTPSFHALGVALQADGKIVAVGGPYVARYLGADDVVGVPAPVRPLTALETYPNPSRGEITFVLHAPTPGLAVGVEVLDVAGRVLKRWEPRLHAAGSLALHWDRLADDGRRVASGLYFVRASTLEGAVVRRVALTD